MGRLVCRVGGVDVTQYFRESNPTPAGVGVIGTATFNLSKQAGGLNILDMMPVEFFETFNDAGQGIAPRGRFFGGIIADRETRNIGTEKVWRISCQDYNVILDTVVRDAAPAYTIYVAPASFATQIQDVVWQLQHNLQGSVAVQIDATSYVANLYPGTLPAQTVKGESMRDAIQKICNAAQQLSPALRPRFFMGVGTDFGVGATFGPPCLHVYDGALMPSPAFSFDSSNIFGEWRRGVDATRLTNRRQSVTAQGFVSTYPETASGGTYPNPYINHGLTGGKGYWMDKPVEDRESVTAAQQDAAIRRIVQQTAYPRESISFETDLRVMPGDVVEVFNDLESLDHVPFRVVGVSRDFSELTPWSSITLGARRLELFEEGEEGIDAAPLEGDPINPDPPGTLSVTSNVAALDGFADVTLQAPVSPSPDVMLYRLYDGVTNALVRDNIAPPGGGTLSVAVRVLYGVAFSYYLRAVDSSYNQSVPTNTVSGTAAVPNPAPPPTLILDTTNFNPPLGYQYLPNNRIDYALKWTAPSGTPPTDYEIESWDHNDPTGRWITYAYPPRDYVVRTGVRVPMALRARIRSRVLGWPGPWTDYTGPSIPVEIVPTVSNVVQAVSRWDPDRQLAMEEITFSAATPASGMPPVDHYLVRCFYGSVVEEQMLPANVLRAVFYLTAGISYTVQVLTVSTTGAVSAEYPGVPPVWTAASRDLTLDLPNPDFEDRNPRAPASPARWSINPNGGSAGLDTDRTSGKLSLLMSKPEGFGIGPRVTSEKVTARPSTTYNLIMSSKYAAATGPLIEVYLLCFNSAGTALATQNAILTNSTAWSRNKYSFTTPANTAYVQVQLNVDENYFLALFVWYDDLVLFEVLAGDDQIADNSLTSTTKLKDLSPSPAGTLWDRVTVNAKGLITAGVSNRGSSFPVGWPTNVPFFRTDHGVWCYNDGTRWLGIDPVYVDLMPATISASYGGFSLFSYRTPPEEASYIMQRLVWRGRVNTTNDASNYWYLQSGIENTGLGGALLSQSTTVGKAVNSTFTIPETTFSNQPRNFIHATGDSYRLWAQVATNGSPGTLDLFGCVMTLRRIYT